MAHVDPTARLKLITGKKFELKIHEIEPENLDPLGDRYIVEVVDVDETVEFGSMLVVTQGEPTPDNDPRNPMANPQVERRGVMPAVIVSVGNGHLLGLPDPAFLDQSAAAKIPSEFEDAEDVDHETQLQLIKRAPADVPMFCEPGDVVLVDVNAKGRALRIAGRTLRVVNQMDILTRVRNIKLRWTGETWERVTE